MKTYTKLTHFKNSRCKHCSNEELQTGYYLVLGIELLMKTKFDEKYQIIDLYGNDHSPWVQSVLLYLYDKNMIYNLRTIPTLSLSFQSGVMMPAMRLKSNVWKLDSADILQSLGCDPITNSEKKLIFKTWQGVQHRVDNPFRFFHAFSICKGFHNKKYLTY